MFSLIRRWRRGKIMQRPFPAAWVDVLNANVKLYPRLTPTDQLELQRHILVFLNEKHFEGCRGVTINDEIRVTIAGNACLLLLHRRTNYFPEMVTILVYPSTFFAKFTDVDEHGLEMEEQLENAGESWDGGNVILAWDVAKHGAIDPRDGLNVIIHEFAHQLDSETGQTDGAPLMESRGMAKRWAEVFQREYDQHCQAVDNDQKTVIDDYGAENPAEFFAVCVETFFEKPTQLKENHADLYAALQAYFKQDPASWKRDPAG
jgi:Mlc titration factor MtfA (ptsG expression regulator)